MTDRPSQAGEPPPCQNCGNYYDKGWHDAMREVATRLEAISHVPYTHHAVCAYLDELRPARPAPRPAGPPKKSPRREELGVMLRELEVIVSNYHDSPAAHRREGDANLFAQWVATRERLFDALSDLTAENEALRAASPAVEPPRCGICGGEAHRGATCPEFSW